MVLFKEIQGKKASTRVSAYKTYKMNKNQFVCSITILRAQTDSAPAPTISFGEQQLNTIISMRTMYLAAGTTANCPLPPFQPTNTYTHIFCLRVLLK